jgi:hypothetical protein
MPLNFQKSAFRKEEMKWSCWNCFYLSPSSPKICQNKLQKSAMGRRR